MELEWSRKNSRPIFILSLLLGLIAKSRKYFGHGIHHDGSVERKTMNNMSNKKIILSASKNIADRLIGWT